MFAKAEGVALPDPDLIMTVHRKAELAHQHESFLGGDDFDLGPADQNFLQRSAVVRLHVVDDQIIQRTVAQKMLHVLHQLTAAGPVNGVKQNGLFIQKKIRVVGNPLGNGMNVLKQGQAVVVGAHPVQPVGYFTNTIHDRQPPFAGHAGINWSLRSAHSGQAQSFGSWSKGVPGAMPAAGSPTAGSYS